MENLKDLLDQSLQEVKGSYGSDSSESKQLKILRSIAYSNIVLSNALSNIVVSDENTEQLQKSECHNCKDQCQCDKPEEEYTSTNGYDDYINGVVVELEKIISIRLPSYNYLNQDQKVEFSKELFEVVYHSLIIE